MIGRFLPPAAKQLIKQQLFRARLAWIRRFRAYSAQDLEQALRALGLASGDTLMVHASFDITNGFRGDARGAIDCLLAVLGPDGNLMMPSMAYASSAYDYLKNGKPFDVRRTASQMGMITEIFRRRRGVLRSANAVHPILALGPKAAQLIEGHGATEYSAGPATPFERLADLDGRILFFDVDYLTCTFLHHLEHRLERELPVNVYHAEVIATTLTNAEGREVPFRTRVFDPRTVKARDALWLILKAELEREGSLPTRRVGNTTLMLVKARTLVTVAERLAREGRYSTISSGGG